MAAMNATTPYRLLALDIDGTLLTSQGTIAPSTIEAVARARAHGIEVTLATGRRLSAARPSIAALGITLPVVLQSGALIVETESERVLYTHPLPESAVEAGVWLAVGAGVQPILFQNDGHEQYVLTGPEGFDSAPMHTYLADRPDGVRRLPYSALCHAPHVLEIAIINDRATVEQVATRVHLAHERTLISYSSALDSYFLELFHQGCSKGTALAWLTARLAIPMEAVVAVGDNYNDREMLQMVGLGVAMGNAEPEIIAVADRVTTSNDNDGIAALIDSLLRG